MADPAHILVVEDEPLVSATVATALEDQFVVTIAASATAAEQELEARRFAAVLLDCLLPGGRAADVIAAADRKGIPVILMSGAPDQINALAGGSRPFVSKPFSIQQLSEVLRRVLG